MTSQAAGQKAPLLESCLALPSPRAAEGGGWKKRGSGVGGPHFESKPFPF